jgi:phosphoribosylanthranilate isomerase
VRIKICGITRREDAEDALWLGANAIGCIFFYGSPRGVSLSQAREISRVVRGLGMLVGLFVNPTKTQVEEALAAVPIHCLQFHGAETPEFCAQFSRPYIKAVPMTRETDLMSADARYEDASALLLDSVHEGQFGGSGAPFDWERADLRLRHRVVLAGGLTPDNVARAIEVVKPIAVDVSSGVESQRGIKDIEKMRAFISNARQAAKDLAL